MDILRAHIGTMSIGVPDSLRLEARHCEVCLEPRNLPRPSFNLPPPVASVALITSIQPLSATVVWVKLPPCLLGASYFVVDPLLSLLLNTGFMALPSVYGVAGATCVIALANPTRNVVRLREHTPVAAVRGLQ